MKIFNFSQKKLWLPFVFGFLLISIAQSAHPEGMGSEGASGTLEQGGAVRQSPSFREADKNGDHYVTKEELQGYPDLLKRFDEVDAGKTGRLEEHEYGNLVMEKSREKGR